MARLAAMGIDEQLVQSVGLGMKEPYTRTDGTRSANVLTFPLTTRGSRRRYGYLNLPGVTLNPKHELGWGPGEPEVVSSRSSGHNLLICASAFEVWQVQRAAAIADIEVVAECSSQPGRFPSAWLDRRHWARHARVIVTGGVATHCTTAIARLAQRPIERSDITFVDEEWRDDAAMARRLVELLDGARSQKPAADDLMREIVLGNGDFSAKPISVHGGMSDGRSFYAFTVERRRASGSGRPDRLLHLYHTVVLRSDGALLEATTLPAPAGTPAHRRVHALSDGTRINPIHDPGHYCSWSLSGIRRFVTARQTGEDPCYVAPQVLAAQAVTMLRNVVVLPRDDDYFVLVAFIIASYLFRLFDALPIIHLHGERGSGKSELTSALVALSFNGQTMAQGSAAALIRLVRETGGLVALDDAEALAGGGGEVGQALKQGYKQLTATKFLTLPGGRTEAVDFFGPRVVSNTLGLDPILGSRAIRIPTSVSADGTAEEHGDDMDIAAWRDAVHAFAMSRLDEVGLSYESARRRVRTRHDEIWAPLLAIANVVGNGDMIAALSSRAAQSI